MLFDENQMLDICKKYGIDVIEKDGYPLYMGEEMDENFSAEQMMKEHNSFHTNNALSSKECIKITIPVFYETQKKYNHFLSESNDIQLDFKIEKVDSISSSISYDNVNKFAA